MDFTTLGAILRTYEHNAKVIHWGAYGPRFDRVHKLCDEFEEMFHADVDFAGETGLRIDQAPPSFDNIMSVLENSDHNYIVCQYKLIGYDEAIKTLQKMCADVMQALIEIHESELMQKPENMGIKSTIESVYDKYDFQVRYLNKRRAMPKDAGEGYEPHGGHGEHEPSRQLIHDETPPED